ncbi:hypothetical protein D3C77_511740 [compost metagenome]
MSGRQRTALDVEFAAVDRAQRLSQPQAMLTVVEVFPGLEGAQYLGGEGFMDFVVVKVLQAQAIACQQARHRVGRRHQQPFLAFDEVHGRRFAIDQIGQHVQIVLAGPVFTAQQYHRSAIGQRRRVTRRQAALVATLEGRFEAGELLECQVRT